MNNLTRNISCGARTEPVNRLRHILRFSYPSQRNLLQKRGPRLLGKGIGHFRLDKTWRNRIDGDKWLGGFSYDEIEEFQSLLADALRVRGEMEAAAQAAADKAQAENDAVNEMTAQLEGQAA